jgi:hypothetical protein
MPKTKTEKRIIIAVDRVVDDSEPIFQVLDMAEDRNLTDLYRMHCGNILN